MRTGASSPSSPAWHTAGPLGRIDEGRQQGERARRYAAEMGDSTSAIVATIDMNLAELSVALGRYRDALALFDAALPMLEAGASPAWQRSVATILPTPG